MNLKISGARLLAAALGALALAGCDSIKNVQEEPLTALPDETVVLGGQIKDLGSRRALVLQYNGTDTCLVPETPNDPSGKKIISECRFFGVPDQEFNNFSFGALPVGTPYNITVKRQPFGRICTVQNPSGTVQIGGPAIQVVCVEDPAVDKFAVTVNIAAPANLPGLTVTLTTEYGTCPVEVNGRPSVTFSPSECPNSVVTGYHANSTFIFNNGTSLPNTPWRVTATIPGPTSVSPPTNCFVTGGPVANTGGNVNDNGEVDAANRPTGPVTTTVQSCGFRVRAQADYSRPTGVTADPDIAPGDGITVALRTQPWGQDVAVVKLTSFANTYVPFMVPDANGEPTDVEYDAQSDLSAFYELVVKQSPAGMVCIPGSSFGTGSAATSTRTAGHWTDAGAVLLRRPASAYIAQLWLVDRVIRCREALTDESTQLRGSYWQHTLTTTTAVQGGGTPTVSPVYVRNRNVLTFFEDGQYLFGNHGSGAANNGVEQGFYQYNPGAQTLRFVAFTDTNGSSGLHASAGNGNPSFRDLTLVTRENGNPKRITTRVSSSTVNGFALTANALTVTINNGQAFAVPAATYNTGNFAAFVNAVQGASPGSPAGMVVANGNEITITGPPGGVVFGGSAVATLGLPTSVAAGATATSTNVGATLSTVTTTTTDWVFEEVGRDPLVTTDNPLDGAWVTWDASRTPAPVEDRRRIFVYQHALYTGMHIGVNGLANLQEACFVGNFGLSGTWTRQGGRSGCSMRTYTLRNNEALQDVVAVHPGCPFPSPASVTSSCSILSSGSSDIPNATTALKDYPGRWPQSQNPDFTDGRPYSLIEYEVRLANSDPSDPICPTLDKLTVHDTQHGTRKSLLDPPVPPIVLCRMTSN